MPVIRGEEGRSARRSSPATTKRRSGGATGSGRTSAARGRGGQLLRLQEDPQEKHNLIDKHPEEAQRRRGCSACCTISGRRSRRPGQAESPTPASRLTRRACPGTASIRGTRGRITRPTRAGRRGRRRSPPVLGAQEASMEASRRYSIWRIAKGAPPRRRDRPGWAGARCRRGARGRGTRAPAISSGARPPVEMDDVRYDADRGAAYLPGHVGGLQVGGDVFEQSGSMAMVMPCRSALGAVWNRTSRRQASSARTRRA